MDRAATTFDWLIRFGFVFALGACGDAPAEVGGGGSSSTGIELGGAGGAGGVGGGGGLPLDWVPELADDVLPYELAAECAELTNWELPPEDHPRRIAAVARNEAYVVTSQLLHLLPDGDVVTEPLDGVADVWRCPGVTWAVGARGLVARKADGGEWEVLDAGFTWDVFDSGVGCDGDVWLASGFDARVFDGQTWRSIPVISTVLGDGTVLEHDVARMRGASTFRIATSNYGATLAYFPVEDAFIVVAGTDDLISDAVVFRDGTGFTLYHGHSLGFDRSPELDDPDSPLDGVRAARRADDDIWVTQSAMVRRFDGAEIVDEPLPDDLFAEDVDARHDGVWTAGFGGVAVRTEAGWCVVAPTAAESL